MSIEQYVLFIKNCKHNILRIWDIILCVAIQDDVFLWKRELWCWHIYVVINERSEIVVHSSRRVIQRDQKIRPDVSCFRRASLHIEQHILYVLLVKFQKPRLDCLFRNVLTLDTNSWFFGTNGIEHYLHDFVYQLTVRDLTCDLVVNISVNNILINFSLAPSYSSLSFSSARLANY